MYLLCLQDFLKATDSISNHMFKLCTDKAEGVSDLYLSMNYRQRSYLKYHHADTTAFVCRRKLTLRDFFELVMKHSFLLPLKFNKLAFSHQWFKCDNG